MLMAQYSKTMLFCSARALAVRRHNFAKKVFGIQMLHKSGICTAQLVRAAGSSAITYGADVVGISDTHLARVRSTIARVAAPAGAGKSPDLILMANDCAGATLDPVCDAHLQPLKQWATA